jgi:putative transposase
MTVKEKAYKFRFYPSEEQKENILQTFGCCRFVYNHFLNEKSRSWKEEKKSLNYCNLASLLCALKLKYEWLCKVSSVCLQQVLRNLDRAYQNFFKKKALFPSFKKKGSAQSATYMRNAFQYNEGKLYLAKQKTALNIRFSRSFKGEVSSVTISKDACDRYFVSFLVREEIEPLAFVKKEIGIDLGISHTIVDNTGQKIVNPKFFKKSFCSLKRKQQQLSKKKKGSNNRSKAKLALARCHAKIKDQRLDFLHKETSRLVYENQVIAVEDLAVKNMQQNKKLSKEIADVGFATFLRLLEYKCLWYGRYFVQVDKFFPSSKTCSCCGDVLKELPLSTRQWECTACKSQHDRDVNAAKNILKEALRLLGEKFSVPRGSREYKPVES